MKKNRLEIFGLVLAMSAMLLGGCGNNDVDNVKADLEADVENATGTDVVSEKSDNIVSLDYNVDMPDGRVVSVKADVDTSVKKAKVYDTEIFERKNEDFVTLANKFFDNGEYEIIKPDVVCSSEEAVEYYNRFKADADKAAKENGFTLNDTAVLEKMGAYELMTDFESVAENAEGDLAPYQELVDGQIIYNTYDYTYAGTMKGNYNGEPWVIFYYNYWCTEDSMTYMYEDCIAVPYDKASETPIIDEEYDTQDSENKEGYEAGKKAADEFIDRLELDNWDLVYSTYVASRNKKIDKQFSYSYAPCPEGVNSQFIDSDLIYLDSKGRESSIDKKGIMIVAGKSGINYIRLNDFYDININRDKEADLMEFDEIDAIFKDTIANKQLDVYTAKIYVTDVKLGYTTVSYGEDKNSYMPVWIYYYKDYNSLYDGKSALVMINAVDGELIRADYQY